jgi:hypothetical protein
MRARKRRLLLVPSARLTCCKALLVATYQLECRDNVCGNVVCRWKDGSVVLIDVPHCLKMSEAEDEVALDVVTEGVYNITKYFEDMDVDVLPYHVVMGVITSPLVKDTEEVEGAKVSPFVQRLRQLLRERKGG